MSSRPDFHSYFETDALVRLELHCKTFLPLIFVAEKIFLPINGNQLFSRGQLQILKFSPNHCVKLLTATTTWN